MQLTKNVVMDSILNYIGTTEFVEVEYCKMESSSTILHINNIKFSEKYGRDYIYAYCYESLGIITLKISRIQRIQQSWTKIEDKTMLAPKRGIYVFTCLGDNHLVYEVYKMEKGEPLWMYFSDKFSHMNGHFTVEPIAFHYVGPFL